MYTPIGDSPRTTLKQKLKYLAFLIIAAILLIGSLLILKHIQPNSNQQSKQMSSLYSTNINGLQLIPPAQQRVVDVEQYKRVLIMGDVHGCNQELHDLINQAMPNYNQSEDLVVFVGDLMTKGPYDLESVQSVMDLGGQCVLGNHDHQVLKCAYEQGRLKHLQEKKFAMLNGYSHSNVNNNQGEIDHHAHHAQVYPLPITTYIDLQYYGSLPDCGSKCTPEMPHYKLAQQLTDEQLEFLACLPLIIQLPQYDTIVVHAGLLPGVNLSKQKPFDLMNIRDVLPDGTGSNSPNGTAWTKLYKGPELVVFGHDAVRKLQKETYAVGLDTGCCYGGNLSGYLLPDKKVVQVPAKRVYSESIPRRNNN